MVRTMHFGVYNLITYCRRLAIGDFITCLTSVPPSAELVPLIRLVNPDFIWWFCKFPREETDEIQKVLVWLRVSHCLSMPIHSMTFLEAISPIPKDLLHLWEGYRFLSSWDAAHSQAISEGADEDWYNLKQVFFTSPQILRVLQRTLSDPPLVALEDCRQFLAQSPKFVRILQARYLLHGHLFGCHAHLTRAYHIQLLLPDISWHDIMDTVSALPSILGDGSQTQYIVAGTMVILALSLEFDPASAASLTSDLARGFLHFIQRIGARELSLCVW
jgi:hypothetical protein